MDSHSVHYVSQMREEHRLLDTFAARGPYKTIRKRYLACFEQSPRPFVIA
jgi:hypothetical protein